MGIFCTVMLHEEQNDSIQAANLLVERDLAIHSLLVGFQANCGGRLCVYD
jgi:hypothetical protein